MPEDNNKLFFQWFTEKVEQDSSYKGILSLLKNKRDHASLRLTLRTNLSSHIINFNVGRDANAKLECNDTVTFTQLLVQHLANHFCPEEVVQD